MKAEIKDWPVLPGGYQVKNSQSCVGIVTVGSKLDFECDYALKGKMHTENLGVERVVLNTISNPNIRFIIICGRETMGHRAGNALKSLWEHGVGAKGRISQAKGAIPFIENVSDKAIKIFKEQIEIIDMLGETDVGIIGEKIEECIAKDPGCFSQEQYRETQFKRVIVEEECDDKNAVWLSSNYKIAYDPINNIAYEVSA